MVVEPLILDGKDGLNQVRGDVGQIGVDAPLLENGEDEAILTVINRRRLVHFSDPAYRVLVGKTPMKIYDIPERKRTGEKGGDAEPEEQRTNQDGRAPRKLSELDHEPARLGKRHKGKPCNRCAMPNRTNYFR